MMGAYTSVSLLFFTAGPLAISLFVVAVVVNSVECKVRWTDSHVGQEIFEAGPSIAYGDAAPPVILVAGGAWVTASGAHAQPRVVGGRVVEAVRLHRADAPSIAVCHLFSAQATATKTYSRTQTWAVDRASATALAAAQPSSVVASFDDGPTPKCLAG